MPRTEPRLLASCWTSAGDAAPLVGDERSPLDLEDRMRAAAAAGWQGFGIVHADLIAYRDTHGLDALAALVRDCGIQRLELEFIGNWWADGEQRTASDIVRRDLLEAAQFLGAPMIKIAPAIDAPPTEDRFLAELDALANDARAHGTRVAIEPMPFSTNVRTLEEGARILDAVGNPAAGLVVDIWHVFRAGMDYSRIPEVLRAEQIFVVELDDGAAEPVGSLWDDTVDRRKYPGQGSFDVARFISAIRRTGFDGYWGVEIISAEHRARPIAQSLPQLRTATLNSFAAAELIVGAPARNEAAPTDKRETT